jgi:hypothetical protein
MRHPIPRDLGAEDERQPFARPTKSPQTKPAAAPPSSNSTGDAQWQAFANPAVDGQPVRQRFLDRAGDPESLAIAAAAWFATCIGGRGSSSRAALFVAPGATGRWRKAIERRGVDQHSALSPATQKPPRDPRKPHQCTGGTTGQLTAEGARSVGSADLDVSSQKASGCDCKGGRHASSSPSPSRCASNAPWIAQPTPSAKRPLDVFREGGLLLR